MKASQQTRLENAECYSNGLKDEKDLDLLRECVKSILNERRAKKGKPKLRKRTPHQ